MFKRKKKKTGCETPEFKKTTLPPNHNFGWQPTKSLDTKPPKPPTSGSNVVKPNPNYIPPASVTKPRTMIYSMKLEDLEDWVKTKAQIGDIAYYYDRMLDHHYIYCYRKPDDNPFWIMMQPEILEKYFKTENKGEDIMTGTINCTYETPCGWCTKWDKKCDKKIGCVHNDPTGPNGAMGTLYNCEHNDKAQRGLRVKINPIDDACDSTDAMNVVDTAIGEIKLLETIMETEKYSDSVYNSFRKEVCAACMCQECIQSQMDIVQCPKFENYFEV